jgi:sulfatase modifying factor 1
VNAVVGFQSDIGFDRDDDVDIGRADQRIARRNGPEIRRRHRPTGRVGGMHCRRQKRWTWGHGRGARLSSLKALVGLGGVAVAMTVALAAPYASALTLDGPDFLVVGNAGNPGNNTANGTFGAVSYVFQIAQTETTNAQYAAFLNEADANGTNPNLIYSGLMASSPLGGIDFNSGGTPGAKYTVKTGLGSRPVNFVSWNSAARFMNFYTTNGLTTETGSYDMTNLALGRLGSAIYVLPSLDEYYKASFYTGSGSVYTTYQTNSNATPTASGVGSALPNTANFGNSGATPPSTGPVDVGSFTSSASFYGLFDALGNVTEYTDRLNGSGTQATRVGGNWSMAIGDLSLVDANAFHGFGGLTATNNNLGFRVAAVPEPGTIGMAVVGGTVVLGGGWMKRRRSAHRGRSGVSVA